MPYYIALHYYSALVNAATTSSAVSFLFSYSQNNKQNGQNEKMLCSATENIESFLLVHWRSWKFEHVLNSYCPSRHGG